MRFITEEQLIAILKRNNISSADISLITGSTVWASCHTCKNYNGYCRIGNVGTHEVCGCWELANRLKDTTDCKECLIPDVNCYEQCKKGVNNT